MARLYAMSSGLLGVKQYTLRRMYGIFCCIGRSSEIRDAGRSPSEAEAIVAANSRRSIVGTLSSRVPAGRPDRVVAIRLQPASNRALAAERKVTIVCAL